MKSLAQYLKDENLTQEVFAHRVGVAQATLSRLVNGAMNPSPELAKKIDVETAGAVPFWAWPPYAVFAPDCVCRGDAS